jgi:MFS family permease
MFTHLSRLRPSNTHKIAALTFFSSLYFYSHVGTLYLQDRGLNLFQVNSISAIIIGTIFLAEVPTGVIADRIGRRWSIVAAMALQTAGELLYLLARDYWAFAAISEIAGVGFAFSSGAVEALIYDTLAAPVGQARNAAMKEAMGLVGAAYQTAFFLAPITGTFLIPVYTLPRFLFVVFLTACSVGVALLIAFTLVEPPQPAHVDVPSPFHTVRQGFAQLRASRRLQWLLLIALFTSPFSMVLVGLYQPYFQQAGIPAFGMGWAFALGALIAALGTRYVYKIEQWLGPRLGLWTVTILPGLAYLLLALANRAPLVFLCFVLTYGTTTLKDPLFAAYQNALITPAQRATVLSLINLCTSCYVALMALVVGWLADIDLRYGFALIGAVIVAATVVLRVERVGGQR